MSALQRAAKVGLSLGAAGLAAYKLLSDGAHRARIGEPAAENVQEQAATAVVAAPKLRERALLFGDSITQYSFGNKKTGEPGGWGGMVATEFARTLDVVNRGFSGYTTRGALQVADQVLEPTAPAAKHKEYLFVTLFFGANDSADKDLNPAQSVPVDEYKRNLAQLVDKAQAVADHVVIISPPAVDAPTWGESRESGKSDRVNARTQKYCEAGREVAAEKGVLFVDTFHAMLRHNDWESFLNDGLHLSLRGNQLVYDELVRVLKNGAGISDDMLPFDFPQWRELSEAQFDENGHFAKAWTKTLPYKCREY